MYKVILIILLLLIGCASNPKIKVIGSGNSNAITIIQSGDCWTIYKHQVTILSNNSLKEI